jgi:hypothetical protein
MLETLQSLRQTGTIQNYIHEEVKNLLNFGERLLLFGSVSFDLFSPI